MRELAYAEINASQTGILTADVDLSGLTVSFVAPSNPVMLRAHLSGFQQLTSIGIPILKITDMANAVVAQQGAGTMAINAITGVVEIEVRSAVLTPGQTYSYKCRASTTAGGCTASAAATQLGFLQVIELN